MNATAFAFFSLQPLAFVLCGITRTGFGDEPKRLILDWAKSVKVWDRPLRDLFVFENFLPCSHNRATFVP
jgi:hypothetical protein